MAKKAERIPAKSVQTRQLFDESELMREWVSREDWQDVLEESDDRAELISSVSCSHFYADEENIRRLSEGCCHFLVCT